MPPFRPRIPHLLLALLIISAAMGCNGASSPPPVSAAPAFAPVGDRILVDSIHAHNALAPLTAATAHSYHHLYGYRRALEFLRHRGLEHDEITEGRLTPALLSRYRMVLLNLVSADLPPFMHPEINALRDYISAGGSLLLITDHSNCYYHAHKLAPLAEELGLIIPTDTACDHAPDTLGEGNGWIAITRFKDHPVTRGLRCIAFQVGGAVDPRYAIATTSADAWGDAWSVNPYGENNTPGFYGNWRQDPGEPKGPLGVVAARKLGKGRIVVVADQNIFADPFLDYHDNARLLLNAVGWLTGLDAIPRHEAYQQWRRPRILAFEEPRRSTFGNSDNSGFYHLFVELGRHLPVFADNRVEGDYALLLFAHNDYTLASSTLERVARHLRAGRNIMVLHTDLPARRGESGLAAQLIATLGKPATTTHANSISLQWPRTGQLILLTDRQGYGNDYFPRPEQTPDGAQAARATLLLQRIRSAISAGEGSAPVE